MKIHFKVTEDPMSFQNLLARRRTQKTFSKLEVFTWIRSFNVLLMKHWGLCTPRFVKIPSVELLNISLKSEFKNCLHWSWNRVGLCFKRQQGKKGKYFKVKTMWLRKCDAKKSLVLMLDRLSFLWDWCLWKNIMYVEMGCAIKNLYPPCWGPWNSSGVAPCFCLEFFRPPSCFR